MQQATASYYVCQEWPPALRILSIVFMRTQSYRFAAKKQYVLVMDNYYTSRTYFVVAGISNFFSRSAAARKGVEKSFLYFLHITFNANSSTSLKNNVP
jgi:hypothetical protein